MARSGCFNLAHDGHLAHAGWVTSDTGSFIVAVIAGSLFVMLVGVVMERIDHQLYSDRTIAARSLGPSAWFLHQGGTLFLRQLVESRSRPATVQSASPRSASAPTYDRLTLLGIVAVSLLALYIVLYRSRIGMIVRAGNEDSVMVDSLGIDVYKVFMSVFGIGAMAAGFAGIINAPVVSIAPDVGESILVQTFVVVVIGGVGSFPARCLAA